ncbi:uncharacterized protein EV154DRAFT_425346 [Mucor mucedo]|uniref:uncharacterized protein n=1 Tax=Mucor mucedo TaxID=29922 RepID=UPI00221E3F97|nr:uncharacterized protein EV154DRAFT_425346 [Mucor mucedo]KAI7888640.1 hypothetical protein EV154DRAFT_425346 [Mucor mucedo]
MTMQVQSQGITDGRLKYNGDGKILVEDLSTEILLSEVSSSYDENSKGKTSFDHHKAMFGLLAIIRTIASLYNYGSFETFSKLKLHLSIHTVICYRKCGVYTARIQHIHTLFDSVFDCRHHSR